MRSLTLRSVLQILSVQASRRNVAEAPEGNAMKTTRRSLLKKSAATAATLAVSGSFASAQAEAVRIGVVYDLSGPFAAGGSAACAVGAQIAIDLVNERGGIAGKYKAIP